MDQELVERARTLLDLCRTKGLTIAAAESCTGGLLAATLTEIAGSSDVFERGFVTYSNEAKQAMVGVTSATLASHGAVSRETAEAMASGALAHAPVRSRRVDHRDRRTRRRGAGQARRPRAFCGCIPCRSPDRTRAQLRRHRPHASATRISDRGARHAARPRHNRSDLIRLTIGFGPQMGSSRV